MLGLYFIVGVVVALVTLFFPEQDQWDQTVHYGAVENGDVLIGLIVFVGIILLWPVFIGCVFGQFVWVEFINK